MKNLMMRLIILFSLLACSRQARTQVILVDLIREVTGILIRSLDLDIQKQQNQVLSLQLAQKNLEDLMHRRRLDQLTADMEAYQQLDQRYFEELQRLKEVIRKGRLLRRLMRDQQRITETQQRLWKQWQTEPGFRDQERQLVCRRLKGMMARQLQLLTQIRVYDGTLSGSWTDMDRLEHLQALQWTSQKHEQQLWGLERKVNAFLGGRREENRQDTALEKWFDIEGGPEGFPSQN